MPFTGTLQLEHQDIRVASAVQQHKYGQVAYTGDGRQFVYGGAGAADLAAGKLAQAAAVVANHQALAVAAAAAIGALKITVTLAGTAATQDQYRGGFAVVRDVDGAGQALPIVGNSAQTSTTGNVDVYLGEGLAAALTTSSKVNLELAPTSSLIIADHTATTNRIVGVPQVIIPANNFGWFQTRGVAAVLGNGSITKGTGLIVSATTDGAVDAESATVITQRLGYALETGTSAKYNTTWLAIV